MQKDKAYVDKKKAYLEFQKFRNVEGKSEDIYKNNVETGMASPNTDPQRATNCKISLQTNSQSRENGTNFRDVCQPVKIGQTVIVDV